MAIEVEIRGPLTDLELNQLSEFLEENGSKLSNCEEVVLFFPENKMLNIKKDQLRIKKNSNCEKIVFKDAIGEELEIHIKDGEIKNLIKLFSNLNFHQVSIAPSKRMDFTYHNATFSIKTNCIIGPHFEVEKMTETKENIGDLRKELNALAQELNLKVWSDEEYKEHKKKCWKNVRPVLLTELASSFDTAVDSSKLIERVIHKSKAH